MKNKINEKSTKMLKALLTNCPSYFKRSADFLSTRVNCKLQDVITFRQTPWYRTNSKRYNTNPAGF